MRSLFCFIILILAASCSGMRATSSPKSLNEKVIYRMQDEAGDFIIERETVCSSRKCVVKQQIFPADDRKKRPLERSVSVSGLVPHAAQGPTSIKNLRPGFSRYFVWLGGKRYFSEVRTDFSKKIIKVKWSGDDEEKISEQEFVLSVKHSYCFYSQILECASLNGFLAMAMRKKMGTMSFYLIWDGYPWFQQQYSGLSDELFSQAKLVYDGEDEDHNLKFVLSVNEQMIFYHVNRNERLVKKFWVSQGLSQFRKTAR